MNLNMKLLCAQFARCPGIPCESNEPNAGNPLGHRLLPAACPGAFALSYLFCGCRTEGHMDRGRSSWTAGQPERCMLPHEGRVSHILPSWTHAGILLCTGLRRQLLPSLLLLLLEMMPCGSMSRCPSRGKCGCGLGFLFCFGFGFLCNVCATKYAANCTQRRN